MFRRDTVLRFFGEHSKGINSLPNYSLPINEHFEGMNLGEKGELADWLRHGISPKL